jgi:hypothetical protein
MRKILVCASFLLLTCTLSLCQSQSWSTLNADFVVDMNTSSAGASLTSGIMSAGTVSTDCTIGDDCVWASPTTSAFSVGPTQSGCSNLGPVQMNGSGGTLFPAQALNYNSVAYNDSIPGAGSNEILTFNGSATSATSVSALVCLTIGPPAQPESGSDYDRLIFFNTPGYYAVLQFNNGNGCTPPSGYVGARIEVKPTAHSSCIYVLPQQTYWFSLNWNINSGVAYLFAYTTGGSQISCGAVSSTCLSNGAATVTAGDKGGGGLHQMYFGNNENGFNNGTTTYFQNIIVNWTSAPSPMFWATGTAVQPPTNLQATVQ